jgi:hypothetical protein
MVAMSFILVGCTFMTGEPLTDKDGNPIKGEYTEAPMVTLTEAITGILGMGAVGGAAARIARNAARARDAILESNKKAIDNADWKEINTAEAFKTLLSTAQDSHDDSVLLKTAFDKWNKKTKKKDLKAKALVDFAAAYKEAIKNI